MFFNLLTIEIRRTLKHPGLWVEAGVLALIFAAYFIVRYAIIAEAMRNGLVNTRGLEIDLQVGLALFGNFSMIFFAATAAIVSAYDYPDRSIQTWLVRGVPRSLLFLARMIIVLGLGSLLIAFIFATILGIAALTRTAFLGGFTAENLNWVQVIPAILRQFAAAVPYFAITVLFGVISRSPLFAAAATIVYATVGELLLDRLSDNYPKIIQFLPSHLAQLLKFNTYLLDRNAIPMKLGGAYLAEPQVFLSIGIILLVCGTLSLIIFSRQDLGG